MLRHITDTVFFTKLITIKQCQLLACAKRHGHMQSLKLTMSVYCKPNTPHRPHLVKAFGLQSCCILSGQDLWILWPGG